MTPLLIHPLCALVPPMDQDDMEKLRKSIFDNGFDRTYPIVLYEGMILDGRSRYQVCVELGVEPYCVQWEPISVNDSPREFVYRSADARRHFGTSQRATMAVNFIEHYTKGGEVKISQAVEQAAKDLKVSPSLINDARRLKERSPEAFDEVRDGKMSVSEATRKVAHEEVKASAPPKVVRDGAGNAVKDKAVKEALKQVEQFDHLIGLLATIKREVLELSKAPVGRALRVDHIELEIKNAIEAIKFAVPFAACPYTTCGTSGCKACAGSRWVTKDVWNNIPSEIREAR